MKMKQWRIPFYMTLFAHLSTPGGSLSLVVSPLSSSVQFIINNHDVPPHLHRDYPFLLHLAWSAEWMNEWTGLTDTIDGNWTGGPTVCVLLHGYLTQPNRTQANLIPPPKKHVMNEFISEGWRMKVQNLVSYHLFHTQPHTVRVQSKSWVNEDKR